jgi:hypothetical protein
MSNYPAPLADAGDSDREHLAAVDDGCGCVEVWETLSEQRTEDDDGT